MPDFEHPLKKYFRNGINYKTCPGCGNGIISASILRAIDSSGNDFDSFAFVSGIGCSGWIPSPFYNTDVLHVTHGRAIAAATGLKLASPDINVMVIAGDGDTGAIGGNHLIHGARRNINITVITVNNRIYGMTGGQAAPTTPRLSPTSSTPFGTIERPFDLCRIVEAAGGTFVARWTTFHTRQLSSTIRKALDHKGFSFIEVLSQCPVHYGKVEGIRGNAPAMMEQLRENTYVWKPGTARNDKIPVGIFVQEMGVPEMTSEIERLRREAGYHA